MEYSFFCVNVCFNCFEYIPRSGIAESCDSMFNSLKNWQTVFQSRCTILNSYWQCMEVPVFPLYHQHLLFSIKKKNYSPPSACEVVCHSSDLHFPYDHVKHIFMCSISLCISFLERCLFKLFTYFWLGYLSFYCWL